MNNVALEPCFHCHLPVPSGSNFIVLTNDGRTLPMCCPGCKAVTETIITLGLSQFYDYREAFPDQAIELIPAELSHYSKLDTPDIYKAYVQEDPSKDDIQSVTLYIEGITCAACVWLLENRLKQLKGVESCVINLSNHIAMIAWRKEQLQLSQLFMEITQLGYKVHLSHVTDVEKHHKEEADSALKRLGVAGLGAMQVMMIAVGLYAGAIQGIEKQYSLFFKWISLIVTVPVFFYVGSPFIKSAFRSIKHKKLGMDMPVAIAITAALLISVLRTFIGVGEVYFDSVAMFLFFLTLGRYLEMRVRHKASDTVQRLAKVIPTTVLSVSIDKDTIKNTNLVPISSVQQGDILLVMKGDTFPADGILLQGNTSINEAMLTGEFMPKGKKEGDYIYAGTKNISQDALLKVTKVGNETRLLSIMSLLSRAQSERPKLLALANKISSWFVAVVLLSAILSGVAWYFIEPAQAFWVFLSVLVISCPCALSLATPIVLTISMNKLSERGVLVLNNRVIEGMSTISHCIFDKTGTLTRGELKVEKIKLLSTINEEDVLSIAGGLERLSEHPIAIAITQLMNVRKIVSISVTKGTYLINAGVEGVINNQKYRIGKRTFVEEIYDKSLSIDSSDEQQINIILANEMGPIAEFFLTDCIRPEAKQAVRDLKSRGIIPIMLTGDASHVAETMAKEIGIDICYKEKSPQQKLDVIKKYSKGNNRVLVVGDGSNDVLAMAGAYLSFAMGAGTDLAKTHSDAVLLNNKLSLLEEIFLYTRRSQAVIKQNVAWAIGYNVIALPIAICGWVHPYIAVIGMSASSIIVTLNAFRLKRGKMSNERASSGTDLSMEIVL